MRFCPSPQLARGALFLTISALLAACSAGQQSTPSTSGSQARASVAKAPAGHASTRDGSRPRGVAGPVFRSEADFTRGAVGPDTTGTVVYNSILTNAHGQTSSYIASLGFECCATDEFGDALVLTQPGRLKAIEVIMDSWACQTGDGYGQNSCVTSKNAKFAWPITVNVYSLTGYPSGVPTVGQLLATSTKTFNIRYRPSSSPHCTGSSLGGFVGPVDKECDFGIADPITFNMRVPAVQLPGQIVVTVAYNTSDSGYNPVGQGTSCFEQGNCPYDSLNVSAWGNGGVDNGVGSAADANGVMVNFTNPYFYCYNNPNGQPPGGTLVDDTPCWTGYHPEISVTTF